MRRLVLASAFLTGLCGAGEAQELPDADFLAELVTDEIPPFWQLLDLQLIASTRSGDAVTPRALMRFESEASPKVPLFVRAAEEGPFVLLMPVAEADAARTLYGVADLGYRAGRWSGEITIENPLDDVGRPADFFGAPTLVLGAEDTEQLLATFRNQAVETELARHAAEVERLKVAHEEAIKRIEAEQELLRLALRTEHDREAANLRAEFDAETEALRQDARAKVAELTDANAPELVQAREERDRRLAEIEEEAEAALEAAKHSARAEIEALVSEHARVRGALLERQSQELAALETRLETRRGELEAQLSASDEVLGLQAELADRLDRIAANSERLRARLAESEARRRADIAGLAGTWEGTASCGGAPAEAAEAPQPLPQCQERHLDPGEETVLCTCGPNPSSGVSGTDVYSYHSHTCSAALHAGVIEADKGGPVMIKAAATPASFRGSARNGIRSGSRGGQGPAFRFETDELVLLAAVGSRGTGERVWPVLLTVDTPFGNGLRGELANVTMRGVSEAAATPATLQLQSDAGSGGPAFTLSLERGEPVEGSMLFDLELGPDGLLSGRARDGGCAEMALARRAD